MKSRNTKSVRIQSLLVLDTREDSWVTEDEQKGVFRALQQRLSLASSCSFSNPPLHENRFNLLLPLLVFAPSHYSPISCCLILFCFSFHETFFFPTCTSHFLQSRDENFSFTFFLPHFKFSILRLATFRGLSWSTTEETSTLSCPKSYFQSSLCVIWYEMCF